MKRYRIVSIIILTLCVLLGCTRSQESREVQRFDTDNNSSAYTLETDSLTFQLDGKTACFTVTDKSSGIEWSSVPDSLGSDTLADTGLKYNMQSAVVVTGITSSGSESTYNSYRYSVMQDTFSIEEVDNGIEVNYLISPNSRIFYIPECIQEARFKELTGRMEGNNKNVIVKNYRKVDINKLRVTDDKEKLLSICPGLEDEIYYLLPTIISENANLPNYMLAQMEEGFASVGYTEEDYENDRSALASEATSAQFNVTVRYELDGDSLIISVPGEKISSNAELMIKSIRVHPFFCSGGISDEGFLLVPDGNGAIIDLNNGRTSTGVYYVNVYGWDENLAREQRIQNTDAQFPTFGINKNGAYLLAIPEQGKGDLSLEADTSGKRCLQNYVSPIYNVVHSEATRVSAKSNVALQVFQHDLPRETYSIRYFFGQGDSYVDMALRYRAYLLACYQGLAEVKIDHYPVALEFIGCIDKMKKIAGVPVRQTVAATDYGKAGEMIDDLADLGIREPYIKYTGTLNGGLSQRSLLHIGMESALGTNAAREELLKKIHAANGKIYMGGYVQEILSTGAFDGFNSMRDGIRNTANNVVVQHDYLQGLQTYGTRDIYLHGLKGIEQSFDNLVNEADKNGFDGINLADLGDVLYSDYNREQETTRTDMILLAERKLSAAHGVMLSGANDYAAVYADYVTDMKLSATGYDLINRSVPFYAIALHGLVPYSGGALNGAGNYKTALLDVVETGAGLYFSFLNADYSELRGGRYTVYYNLYSSRFADWRDTIGELYTRLDSELGHTAGLAIADHRYINDVVTVTVYEDGTTVYVNRGDQAFEEGAIVVPPMDWTVKKGGE